MPSADALAAVSNMLVYSAIAVYILAILAYAWASATVPSLVRRMGPVPVLASTSAASGATSAASGATSSDGTSAPVVTEHGPSVVRGGVAWRVGTSLTLLAAVLHLAGVVFRAFAANRAPWGNMYEFALVGALVAAVAYLAVLFAQRTRGAQSVVASLAVALGVWVVTVVALTLGFAVTVLYVPAGDLIPVLNSYWLVIHVAAAITCAGVFTVGAVTLTLHLVRGRDEHRRTAVRQDRSARGPGSVPRPATLEHIGYRIHVFAFPLWTFAVIAGAIWAENAWGRYWGWDPKETWAFITWVFYAAYLHAAATPSWRGRKAAVLGLLGYVALLFNFVGVNLWISGLHSYAGV